VSQDEDPERIITKSEMTRGRGGHIIMRDMTMVSRKEDSAFERRDRRDLSGLRGVTDMKG
jgi:hypothetical protein